MRFPHTRKLIIEMDFLHQPSHAASDVMHDNIVGDFLFRSDRKLRDHNRELFQALEVFCTRHTLPRVACDKSLNWYTT